MISNNNSQLFSSNIIRIWGDQGRQWLESLPGLTQLLAQKWGLIDLIVVNNLTYNYVMTGKRKKDNSLIVLKLSCDSKLIAQEAQALKFYDGHGAVKLFDFDPEHKTLLLECAVPGVSIKSFFPERDEIAVARAIDVIHRLHSVSLTEMSNFPRLINWLAVLQDSAVHAAVPEQLCHKAWTVATYLIKTAQNQILLHGDLHHDNILSHERNGWVSIDPKGVIGDPAYEVGPFICNPMPEILNQSDTAKIVARRLSQFSQSLHIPEQRLKDWSFVHAVLAACWTVQDGDNPERWLGIAQVIDSL